MITLIEFPNEILFKIAFKLDYSDIVFFCQTSSKLSPIFNDRTFWEQKALLDLNVSPVRFRIPDYGNPLPPDERYIQLATRLKKKVYKGSERFYALNMLIYRAAKKLDQPLLKHFISQSYKDIHVYESVLRGACKGGHLSLVKFAIKKITKINGKVKFHFDLVLKSAVSGSNTVPGNNRKVVDYLINNIILPYNGSAMRTAAKLNNRDMIIKLMSSFSKEDNIEEGMKGACLGGNLELIEFFANLDDDTDWTSLLDYAPYATNKKTAEYIVERAAEYFDNDDWGESAMTALFTASEQGDMEYVKFFLEKGGDNPDFLEGALTNAVAGGHQEIIDLFASMGMSDPIHMLGGAIQAQNVELIRKILTDNPLLIPRYYDFSHVFESGSCGGDLAIVSILFEHQAKILGVPKIPSHLPRYGKNVMDLLINMIKQIEDSLEDFNLPVLFREGSLICN